jgi:hypothetical protein
MGAGLLVVMFAVALMTGDRGGPETADAERPSPTPWAPTPWPDEALAALAASQGPPPATCEPPEAQDLRLVDAAELAAEGLEPAGRVLISGHCPLYVANRVDRAVVWVGGGGLLHFDSQADRRLMTASRCCAQALLTVGGVNYQFSGSSWSGQDAWMTPSFSVIDPDLARIGATDPTGAYLTLTLRGATPTPGRAHHRVAFASDGQMFIDPAPVSGDIVANHLTGEVIDVTDLGPAMPLRVEVGTGAVRTGCWQEHGVCNVYLDGVGGAREGDVGTFNPPVMPAPSDGVLSCVRLDGEFWSLDGPALAYELSNGNLMLRIGAFGGAWEAWGDCPPRDVRRGEEIPVWTYTYIEAFVGGEPRSIVSTRDGRLFVGDVELELGCPCEGRR